MNSNDILGLEYRIGKQCYILRKTELHCIDQPKVKNNFSIPLNQLDPHYSYGGSRYSIFWLLCVGYIVIGIIVRALQWFYGSSQFDFIGNTQLIIFPFFLALVGFQFYRRGKAIHCFRFYYLRDGALAFSLPMNHKNKTKTLEFLQALLTRIYDATPANGYVFYLLCQYGLLTNTEITQLDVSIQKKQTEFTPKENIIHFAN
jgi:hypothetical protein